MKRLLLLPVLLLSACAPSVEDLCEQFAQCDPGNSEDVAECEEEGNELKNEAEALGCGGEFDDYLSCLDGLDVCDEEALENGCQSELNAMSECGDQQSEDDPPAPG